MSLSQQTFDAAVVARPQRKQRWREELSDIHGAIEVHDIEDRPLLGSLTRAQMWRLELYRLEIAPHRIVLPHIMARPGTHNFTKLHFQTKGTTRFSQDGRTIDLASGECLVFNLSWPHELASEVASAHVGVIIPHDLIRRQSVNIERLRAAHKICTDAGARFALDTVQAWLDQTPAIAPGPSARLAEAVLSMMQTSLAHGSFEQDGFTGPNMLRVRARIYIADHLREADLSIADIARALGCSKRHLHTVFRAEGTTVERLIWNERLTRCHEELVGPADPPRSITDIAFSWGFSSSAHFSRAFSKTFGCSPKVARARARLQPAGAN